MPDTIHLPQMLPQKVSELLDWDQSTFTPGDFAKWNAAQGKFVGGGSSASDLSYHYTQSVPSANWTIAHGLGKNPSVSVVDSGGNMVFGDISYIDSNNLTVSFSVPFAGVAYLN